MIAPQESGFMKHVFCIFLVIPLLFQGIPNVNAEQSFEELIGVDFLSELIFFGESTTTHLRCRSKLRSSQIWANESGTARLDSNLAYRPVIDPQSRRHALPVDLAKELQPKYLVLSFGLNGIAAFSQDVDDYLRKYQKLMDDFSQVSPNTRFLIQSIYPVAIAELQQNWSFNDTPKAINEKIELLNNSLQAYCKGLENADFIDTSCVLKDDAGFLRSDCTTDGIHLTEAAYQIILKEISLQKWRSNS